MTPGIHHVPFDEYASWDCLNSTAIRAGSVQNGGSMKRMRWTVLGLMESDDTKDRKLGRALHCLLLEPDHFDFRFDIQEQCYAIKRDGERCGNLGVLQKNGEWFCRTKSHAPPEATEPEDYISEDEHERIMHAIEELKGHPAVTMMRQHGGCEESAIAEINGAMCKVRFDKRLPGDTCPATVIDVKKSGKGISQWKCEGAIKSYGYAIQMALYCRVAKAVTGLDHAGIWVFVEDRPPYDINCIRMTEDLRRESSSIIDAVIGQYLECCEREEWPGVAPELNDFGVYHESIRP